VQFFADPRGCADRSLVTTEMRQYGRNPACVLQDGGRVRYYSKSHRDGVAYVDWFLDFSCKGLRQRCIVMDATCFGTCRHPLPPKRLKIYTVLENWSVFPVPSWEEAAKVLGILETTCDQYSNSPSMLCFPLLLAPEDEYTSIIRKICFVVFLTWICLTRGWYALHRSHRTL
jgi:hypothetical protein